MPQISWRPRPWPLAAAITATSIAVFASVAGWRGGDLAAHLFRVSMFRTSGLTLWDPQWYGGHFTLSYSVLYPPIAATLGIATVTTLSAAFAAWSFAVLGLHWFGARSHVGILLFALGTGSQIAIGQLPFLLGESLALAACVSACNRRWLMAATLGALATMASPLVGMFLLLVLATWSLTQRVDRWRLVALGVATSAPLAITAALFPGVGSFPYPRSDAILEIVMLAILVSVLPRQHRALRIGGALYLVTMILTYCVASPMGGNISRLGESVAIPLAACALWPTRRRILVAVIVPIALWQWTPAWPAITTQTEQPSTHAAYYTPLTNYFEGLSSPPQRVEVVPTKAHFEAAYVAPRLSLARGWERQLDTVDNPIFYKSTALTAASYRTWLLDAGVQYVALPDAPLDYAAVGEAQLVRAGVPGLTPVFSDAHWQVFHVDGSTGLLDGPATINTISGDLIEVRVTEPGTVLLRERYNGNWSIEPQPECFGPDASGWIVFDATASGTYRLRLGLTSTTSAACPAPS